MLWLSDFYGVPQVRRNQWSPRFDFFESGESNVLSIEMPGVARGDVNVSVDDRFLTVEAKRNIGQGEQTWKRQWVLSERINSERIEARLESGILRVLFPKAEAPAARNIEIQ